MQTVLIVVHLLIVLALIGVVLMQRSEGGLGLGGGGSGGGGVSGFMTGRGQANALTRATAILAAMFFTTSITLAILAHHDKGPRSILDGGSEPVRPDQRNQPATADNLLDSLRGQGATPPSAPSESGAPAPQPPAAPAPEAPAPAAPNTPPDAPQSR